jgi:uncharacterized iron-regulated membrane protein
LAVRRRRVGGSAIVWPVPFDTAGAVPSGGASLDERVLPAHWHRRASPATEPTSASGVPSMRKYHRWLAPVFGLFLLFMSVTGIMLALDDMTSPFALERRGAKPAAPPAAAATLPLQESAALLQKALRDAGDERRALTSVRLFAQGAQLRIELQSPGAPAPLLLDARSGAQLPNGAPGPVGIPAWRVSAHGWLEYLHRGAFASWPGMVIVLLAGIALLVFSITGLAVYLDLAKRRWHSGRKAWFW